jgi:Tfp pilus assembly protein PilZ
MDVGLLFREYVRLDRMRESGLTPAELHRWGLLKRKLNQHFSPGLSDNRADQRESVRVPSRIRVAFSSDGALAQSLMTNLSRRGVFVETDHPLEIGAQLELRIHVQSPARELIVPAQVVSHGIGPDLGVLRGMGLRLGELSAEVEAQFTDLYERLVK